MKIRKQVLCAILILLMIMMEACSKVVSLPAEPDWRDRYGTVQNGKTTSEPTVTSSVQDIPVTTTPKPEYEDATSALIPEFVPQEGQVELVLLIQQVAAFSLDEYVVAELNVILQERGYPFYLVVQEEKLSSVTLSKWQEKLDAGEKIDLIYFSGEDIASTYEQYGNVSIMRAIQGEYLIPFSEYPDIEAKQRLLDAYPESYWELSSYKGENYGVSGSVSDLIRYKEYIMLNLDGAEQIGLEIPEQLNLATLDDVLREAEAYGIPGITWLTAMEMCGIELLPGGLYLEYESKGEYRIVNPLENERVLELWDAGYRYSQNGWEDNNPTKTGIFPLIMCAKGSCDNWNGTKFFVEDRNGKSEATVKVYNEKPRYLMEGNMYDLLGIASVSEHKEEALQLLSLMHTDEEIVKLLRYGLEGIHYQINETGELEITNGWSLYKASVGNRLMYLEFEGMLGKENTEEAYYEEISEIEKIPYMEEFTEEQKEQLKKIRAVTYKRLGLNGMSGFMNEASYIVNVSNLDYLEEIEKKTTAFAEAGYNELAEEINEKYGLK